MEDTIHCARCGKTMPRLRKEQFGYDKCIECSDTEPYGYVPIVVGKSDYTIQVLPLSHAKKVKKRTFY